jgi:hypothetical protein
MRELKRQLMVGYAGTALLIACAYPVMYSIEDRRLGAMLVAALLSLLFLASLVIPDKGIVGQSIGSVRWFSLGLAVVTVASLLAGLIPK